MTQRLIAIVVLAVLVTGCAAGRAFRRGNEAARSGDWDAAVVEYTKAVQANPDRADYKIQLERAMQSAAAAHISRARELEEQGALDAALLEYKRAAELDATNRLSASKVVELEKKIRDQIEASRPKPTIDRLRDQARAMGQPIIDLTTKLPSLKFQQASVRDILNFIATSSGINITFDQTFQDRPYSIVLEDVTAEQALQQIMLANQLFYKVLNPKTILVIQDTQANRLKYDEMVLRVFYVSHADVAELAQLINAMMRIATMPVQPVVLPNKTANTITVRATAQVVDIIERLIRNNDKPRAEVIVDVQILEVNRQRVKRLGINLSEYALGLTFSPEVAPPNTPATFPGANPPPFNLNTISQGVSTSDFYLSIPTAVLRFLATDSQTKLIAKPQLRGAEGAKLTLNLGDEVPVLQTVFGAPVAGGLATTPQSSYSYRNVGINIEMTPRVTYDGDIRLELSVESSAIGPSVSVGGQDAQTFNTRRVTTTLRLREGESNLLAGLLRDDQRKILTGFPGLMRVPVLRSLFGQSNDEISQSDIVMLLTPRVVRTHELTAEDLAPIFIGTQQNVGLGGPPPLIAPPVVEAPAPTTPATPPSQTLPTGAPAGQQPPPIAAPAGAQPVNPPLPAGGAPLPGIQPGTPPPAGVVPPVATTPPAGATTPPATTGIAPVTPPRDPNQPLPAAPGTPPSGVTPAQVIITPAGTEFRIAGGPYLAPISINNASRISTMSLTVTYNPAIVRVRSVQQGTFMTQGGITVSFTPKIDAVAGRVDITVTRVGDQVGASGAGLIGSLQFDGLAPGSSTIQVSGLATAPDGTPIQLQFSPVTVTVR
jgi:general secretion pathway protein D